MQVCYVEVHVMVWTHLRSELLLYNTLIYLGVLEKWARTWYLKLTKYLNTCSS